MAHKRDRTVQQILPLTVGLLAFISSWAVLAITIQNTLLPGPYTTAKALLQLAPDAVFLSLWASVRRVIFGFCYALVCGVLLGLISELWLKQFNFLGPILEFLRPVPPIAWLPIALVVFGPGDASAEFIIFLGALFPIYNGTVLGLQQIPPRLREMLSLQKLPLIERVASFYIPAILPALLSGMKVGLGFAWMCVVAAEMIGARSGLGYEIELNRQVLRLDRVVAFMFIIGAAGSITLWLFGKLEKRLTPWCYFSSRPQKNHRQKHRQLQKFSEPASDRISLKGSNLLVEDLIFHKNEAGTILNRLNLRVNAGDLLAIVGKSGCGKTTLLRLIASLEKRTAGQIRFGPDCSPVIAYVPQDLALYPWLTVEQNIELPVKNFEKNPVIRRKIVKKYLALVGLAQKHNRYPHALSGGEQQRVAIARALACSPQILLLDEPCAHLDVSTREELMIEIGRLCFRAGVTTILVTHDVAEAVSFADKVVVLSKDTGNLTHQVVIDSALKQKPHFRESVTFHRYTTRLRTLLFNNQEDLLKEVV